MLQQKLKIYRQLDFFLDVYRFFSIDFFVKVCFPLWILQTPMDHDLNKLDSIVNLLFKKRFLENNKFSFVLNYHLLEENVAFH